jgi:hypothetical protein
MKGDIAMATQARKPQDPDPPVDKQGGERSPSTEGPPAGDGADRQPGGMAGEGGSGDDHPGGPPRGGVEQGG